MISRSAFYGMLMLAGLTGPWGTSCWLTGPR